jgi:zinc D-Ala-D-Ala carboxypeptidase
VQALSLVPDDAVMPSVPSALAAPRSILVVRVSRASDRALLPGCDGSVPVTTITNGNLPAVDLCTLWDRKHQLRADAAIALAKLNLLYRKRFGHDLCLSSAYRTLSEQYAVKRIRGGYAAAPGTSEHGWGLAIDGCDGMNNGPSNENYLWMRANGVGYGWVNPDWALAGGSGPYEPWHFEYLPGEQKSAGPSD